MAAVLGDEGIGKWLAGTGIQDRKWIIRNVGGITSDLKRTHQGLRAFSDVNHDLDQVLVPAMFILGVAFNLHLSKTIRPIFVLQVADITSQQGLAVSSMRKQDTRRLHLHRRAQLISPREILVPG